MTYFSGVRLLFLEPESVDFSALKERRDPRRALRRRSRLLAKTDRLHKIKRYVSDPDSPFAINKHRLKH